MRTIILISCLVLGLTIMPSVSFAGTLPPQGLNCGAQDFIFENQASSSTQVVIQVENDCSGTCTLKARDAIDTVDFALIATSGVKAVRFSIKKSGGSVLLGCEGTGTGAVYSITTIP